MAAMYVLTNLHCFYTYSALYERRRFRRSALDAEPRVSNSHAQRYLKVTGCRVKRGMTKLMSIV